MKNSMLTRALVGSSLVCMFQPAMAQDLNYDYVEVIYASASIDYGGKSDLDGNGVGVVASGSISPNLAIGAGYSGVSYDRLMGVDLDTSSLTFGLLGHTAVAPKTDVYGSFSVLRAEIEVSNGFASASDDDVGNTISVGLRHLASDAVELEISLARVDVFDESETGFGVEARFFATEKLAIGVGYSQGDDADAILLSARIGL